MGNTVESWWVKRNGLIEYNNGTKFWFLNGKYHREDGPAVEYTDGDKHWYLNDKYLGDEEPENWDELVRVENVKIIMEI